jgi:hypothetical protein
MLGTNRKDDFEPYWQDEKDWLCIVEFLLTDNPEDRLFAADIIGYLVGYANLTSSRTSLATLSDLRFQERLSVPDGNGEIRSPEFPHHRKVDSYDSSLLVKKRAARAA